MEEITENLKKAFVELNADPISLTTVIDLYCDEVRNSVADTREYLSLLNQLLSDNHQVINDIGWDIPRALHKLFQRDVSQVIPILRDIYSTVAQHGNPKECLLTGCEILSSLTIEDPNEQKIIQSEFKLLTYLTGECILRISPTYPSKYLSMVSVATLQFLKANSSLMGEKSSIISDVVTQFEELDNYFILHVKDPDEKRLVNQLISHFLTNAITYIFKFEDLNCTNAYQQNFLQEPSTGHLVPEGGTAMKSALARLLELYLKYNSTIQESFQKLLQQTESIYNNLDEDLLEKHQDVLYRLSYGYELQQLADEEYRLRDNEIGIIIFTGVYFLVRDEHLISIDQLSLSMLFHLYLRYVTASLFSEEIQNKSLKDIIMYWIWNYFSRCISTKLLLEIRDMNTMILDTTLQLLLMSHISDSTDKNCLETFAWISSFRSEDKNLAYFATTLMNCPYPQVKLLMLRTLKRFLREDRVPLPREFIRETKSNGVEIDVPRLPNRPVMQLNEELMANLYGLLYSILKSEDFRSNDNMGLLLELLNLILNTRDNWNKNLLQNIKSDLDLAFQGLFNDPSSPPEIIYLKLFLDTLRDFLKSST